MAAPLLAVAFAAPASAAPEDVTVSAEVQGNDVQVTFTNNTEQPVFCNLGIADAADRWDRVYDEYFVFFPDDDPFTVTVDDGSYQIDWFCDEIQGSESWGTSRGTAEPIFFTLPFVPDDGDTDDGSLGNLDPGALVGVLGALAAGSLVLGSS
ncbi:hypothetical protein EF834_01935 [Rhodococcus spongiicola]|uniref:Uncharacterized protein n=1 Tax=Rhodococcus spongiicola TaxID=2487352 RepID=A0A3S3AEK1_9NOCA|nr:hypothetical protein EF834_01935 [Rhodococcus spongiicola]